MSQFDVVKVEPLDEYKLHLTFIDGASGVVDVAQRIQFSGIFQPLADLSYFRQVRVDPLIGTICWDNGADLDPIVLYHLATGKPLPDFARP